MIWYNFNKIKNTENNKQANVAVNVVNRSEVNAANNNNIEESKIEWDTLDEPVIETIVCYNLKKEKRFEKNKT